MDIERLKELRGEVSNVAFIALSKLVDKNARANVVKFGEDLQELIDEAIARQSVKSEEVAEPTTRKDRIVEEVAISKTETTSAKKITVDVQLRPMLDDLEVDIDDIKEYISKLN